MKTLLCGKLVHLVECTTKPVLRTFWAERDLFTQGSILRKVRNQVFYIEHIAQVCSSVNSYYFKWQSFEASRVSYY